MKSMAVRMVSGPLILVAALLLIACSQGPSGSDATSSSTPSLGTDHLVVSRPAVADFTVSTEEGRTFSLSDHRGDVVVLYSSFPG